MALLEENVTPERIVAETKHSYSVAGGQAPRTPRHGTDTFDEDFQPDVTDDDNVDPELIDELQSDQVIVTLSKMHYGMGDKNPLDCVKFYSKNYPDRECALMRHIVSRTG